MKRKLFCEISPLTYKISVEKEILRRKMRDIGQRLDFAQSFSQTPLAVTVYRHKSLIRRKLGNADMTLQENKAVNLAIAAPKVSGILIKPGETFSFWRLVGRVGKKQGYLEGLTINRGKAQKGVGGGMCQFTNLIHWLCLHSPLEVTEKHHHNGIDLFPDYGRQVPFGVGTSILYNYLDYRFKNNTDTTFQLIVWCDDTYLIGELRADKPSDFRYHVKTKYEYFTREPDGVHRYNLVVREKIDVKTGNVIECDEIAKSNARIAYDESFVAPERFKGSHSGQLYSPCGE